MTLYAIERYDPAGAEPAALPALPGVVRLVAAVRLVADDVLLALVEGPDPETVGACATAAGWRIDRLTPATWLTPPLEALP